MHLLAGPYTGPLIQLNYVKPLMSCVPCPMHSSWPPYGLV